MKKLILTISSVVWSGSNKREVAMRMKLTAFKILRIFACQGLFSLIFLIFLPGCLFEPKIMPGPRAISNRLISAPSVAVSSPQNQNTENQGSHQAANLLIQAELAGVLHQPEAASLYRDALAAAIASSGNCGCELGSCSETCLFKKVYNKSLRGLLRSVGFGNGRSAQLAQEKLAAIGVQIDSEPGFIENIEVDELWFPEDFTTVMVREPLRKHGLGVPLVAYRGPKEREKIIPEEFYPPHWKFAVTAIAEPIASEGDHSGLLRIVLKDPLETDEIALAGHNYQMAKDLTTPVIHLLSHSGYRDKARQGLFDPASLTDEEGVTLIHPHRPGRIPFVMIHGMGCSPRIMADIVNSVHADPVLRKRYQPMIVYYTTGDTILQDGEVIREAFRQMRQHYDPAHTDIAWDQSVVLGHSLGGPIARILTSHSDDQFEKALFTRPWNSLVMTDVVRTAAQRAIFFEPVPEFRRVIYLAGTMRGSRLADQIEARALSRILPRRRLLQQFYNEIVNNNGVEAFTDWYRNRVPSSIDNQSPESPLLEATNNLRQEPYVVSHNIQANATPVLPLNLTTDLLVPFTSSYIENTMSSLMLHGQNHFCTHDPRTLAEIKRILQENMN
jgi:pimeloyl-ACP methyl ester carboxylesterase